MSTPVRVHLCPVCSAELTTRPMPDVPSEQYGPLYECHPCGWTGIGDETDTVFICPFCCEHTASIIDVRYYDAETGHGSEEGCEKCLPRRFKASPRRISKRKTAALAESQRSGTVSA